MLSHDEQMNTLPIILRIVLVAVVVTAAAYDFKYRRIPNWLNLSGLILGFGLNLYLIGGPGLLSAGEGFLLALAIYIPLYLLRGMGAGDVKLMAALGAIAGPLPWLEIFIATALLGGLAAAVLAMSKKRFLETCWNVIGILKDLMHLRAPFFSKAQLDIRDSRALRMPHGVTIAIGALGALGLSQWHVVELLR